MCFRANVFFQQQYFILVSVPFLAHHYNCSDPGLVTWSTSLYSISCAEGAVASAVISSWCGNFSDYGERSCPKKRKAKRRNWKRLYCKTNKSWRIWWCPLWPCWTLANKTSKMWTVRNLQIQLHRQGMWKTWRSFMFQRETELLQRIPYCIK